MQNPIGEAELNDFCIVTVKVLNSYDNLDSQYEIQKNADTHRKKCKLLLQNFRRVGWIISMRSGLED